MTKQRHGDDGFRPAMGNLDRNQLLAQPPRVLQRPGILYTGEQRFKS